MKRYLLFAGATYYPEGGWDDFKGSFDTVLEALEAVTQESSYVDDYPVPRVSDWHHVVDSTTGEKVICTK